MADVNSPNPAEVLAEVKQVEAELEQLAEAEKAPEAPAPDAAAPVPTADIVERLADPAAPADFEDRSDSTGQVFRVWKDGRVDLLPGKTVRS